MLKTIIIVAVIASIIVICAFYYKEIFSFIKSKLPKIKKTKKSKKEEKPKENKKVPKPTVEEFKPISKPLEEESRDSSIERLFSDDDDFPFDFDDLIDDDFSIPAHSNSQNFNKSEIDEFEDLKRMLGRKYGKNESNKKNIAQKIKSLPPEIKALLIDNVLKRRDDV